MYFWQYLSTLISDHRFWVHLVQCIFRTPLLLLSLQLFATATNCKLWSITATTSVKQFSSWILPRVTNAISCSTISNHQPSTNSHDACVAVMFTPIHTIIYFFNFIFLLLYLQETEMKTNETTSEHNRNEASKRYFSNCSSQSIKHLSHSLLVAYLWEFCMSFFVTLVLLVLFTIITFSSSSFLVLTVLLLLHTLILG